MNKLKELKQKYKELGEEIERLEEPKFEPQEGKYYVNHFNAVSTDSPSQIQIDGFNAFNSEESAQDQADAMQLRGLLLQARDKLCPGYEFDRHKGNYYPFINLYTETVYIGDQSMAFDPLRVYFDTKENTLQAIKWAKQYGFYEGYEVSE